MKYMQSSTFVALFFILTVACDLQSEKNELNKSTQPITIKAKYYSWACGENTPRISPISNISKEIKNDKLEYGFTFYVPKDLESPDAIDSLAIQDNIFELTGYYYYTEQNGEKFLNPKFDLVSWKALKPLHRWNSEGEKILVEQNQYLNIQESTEANTATFSLAKKYDLCQ